MLSQWDQRIPGPALPSFAIVHQPESPLISSHPTAVFPLSFPIQHLVQLSQLLLLEHSGELEII